MELLRKTAMVALLVAIASASKGQINSLFNGTYETSYAIATDQYGSVKEHSYHAIEVTDKKISLHRVTVVGEKYVEYFSYRETIGESMYQYNGKYSDLIVEVKNRAIIVREQNIVGPSYLIKFSIRDKK